MAFRSDISIDWPRSPRIITVAAPSTELTCQDLLDTLRQIAPDLDNLDDGNIVRSEGKGDLGGGVLTGLTVYLLDAKVAFEGRTTPVAVGASTSDNVLGRYLTDTSAHFIDDGVRAGAAVQNLTDGSFATVFEVINNTTLECFPYLKGGADNKWEIGDSYKIINVDLCKVLGGNLVAHDSGGDTMDALLPTPNVSFGWTTSSSATLQEQDAIQYASFGGGVSLDMYHTRPGTVSGTVYPAGTKEHPTDSVQSVVTIAENKGFDTIFVIGNGVFSAGDNTEGYKIQGQNPILTSITLEATALTLDCQVYDSALSGVLDGNTWIERCRVDDLEYVSGQVVESMLTGSIILSGPETHFVRCYSGVTETGEYPTINMGGSGHDLALEGYDGRIKITNMTGPSEAVLNMNTGRVLIDSTVSAGTVVISGTCDVTDNHTGTATVLNTGVKADTAEILARLTLARAANLDAIPDIQEQATLARKILKNDLKLVGGTVDNWVLMDDDGEHPLLTWSVTGPTGGAIIVPIDSPAWRRLSA